MRHLLSVSFCFSLSLPLSSAFSIFLCQFFAHIHVCPRPCVSTCRWVKALLPTDTSGPRSVRSPCSYAPSDRATTARVSSPRDWAVCIGSHVQQNMDISKPPSRLGAPFPVQRAETSMFKLATIFLQTQPSSVRVAPRVQRPAGDTYYIVLYSINCLADFQPTFGNTYCTEKAFHSKISDTNGNNAISNKKTYQESRGQAVLLSITKIHTEN